MFLSTVNCFAFNKLNSSAAIGLPPESSDKKSSDFQLHVKTDLNLINFYCLALALAQLLANLIDA